MKVREFHIMNEIKESILKRIRNAGINIWSLKGVFWKELKRHCRKENNLCFLFLIILNGWNYSWKNIISFSPFSSLSLSLSLFLSNIISLFLSFSLSTYIHKYTYIYTQPLCHVRDATQGQFLNGVKPVWIQSFPSRQVSTRRSRSSICPTIFPLLNGE